MNSRLSACARQLRWAVAVVIAVFVVSPTLARAAPPDRPLLVGIHETPPFAMKSHDGDWHGIAAVLWNHVARELGRDFRFVDVPIAEQIVAVRTGAIDIALPVVVDAEREAVIDFSHPFFTTGLSIAVPTGSVSPDWFAVVDAILSPTFLGIVGASLLVMLLVGTLLWLVERRHNRTDFGGRPWHGIGSGLWWAAVTATTVGYGDRVPRTPAGRAIAVVWMFFAVIIISSFIAQISSTLTVTGLVGRVAGPADLPGARVGVVAASEAQFELRRLLGVAAIPYPDLDSGFQALARGDIDAFVAGEPILRYEVQERYAATAQVLAGTFGRADFAFALPLSDPVRKDVNRALLGFIAGNDWPVLLRQYLGQP